MEMWLLIVLLVLVVIVGAHVAGVAFVFSRVLLGGRRRQRQWSQR
jgi:hypothetical protein